MRQKANQSTIVLIDIREKNLTSKHYFVQFSVLQFFKNFDLIAGYKYFMIHLYKTAVILDP